MTSKSFEKEGFRPSRYGYNFPKNRLVSKDSKIEETKLVKKGNTKTIEIDLNDIDSVLNQLKKYSSTPIDALPKEIEEIRRKLISYVGILHDSSSYSVLYDKISKVFSDVTDPEPGTVGAHCVGCMISKNKEQFKAKNTGKDPDSIEVLKDAACSPICAGSIPVDRENISKCNNTVILAKFEDYEYNFTVTKKATSDEMKEYAYIFLNSSTLDNFPGFSEDEKRKLKSYGIKYLYINGYKENGKEWVELIEKPITVDECKSRDVDVKHNTNESDVTSILLNDEEVFNKNGFIILTLVLILIGVFFAYRVYHNKQK